MRDGLYKLAYRTAFGAGCGVVGLRDGVISGGDNSRYYVGHYTFEAARFSADIRIRPHTAQPARSVFGREDIRLHLDGEAAGDEAILSGHSPDAVGVVFNAVMTRLAD